MKDIDGQYLVTAYEQASDSWTTFLKEQNVADLHKTLDLLCNALRRLEEDTKFWAALHELPSELGEHQKEAERILADFDSFLALEEKIFRGDSSSQIHLNDVAATRLTNDMNFVLRNVDLARSIVLQRPDALAIENLRKGCVNLQNAVCAAHGDMRADVPRRRFFRYARYGLKALQFVGGGAVIVLNTGGFLTGGIASAPLAVASVYAGFRGMKDIVEEQLEQASAP